MSGANNPANFVWSPEAIDILRELRTRGFSSGQISTELAKKFRAPVSRSAVIGKLSRLGIEGPSRDAQRASAKIERARLSPPKFKAAKTPKERVSKDGISERRVVDLIRVEKEKRAAAPPAVDPDAMAVAPCCLLDLRNASCRWPINRTAPTGETQFCNNAKLDAGPYCAGHAARAFNRVISKEQREAERGQRDRHRAEAYAAGHRDRVFGFGLAKRFA